MTRNKFPRRTAVKLLMCDDPECKCSAKYVTGEDGVVVTARGRYITVRRSDHEGLMAQIVHFRKETAEKHLERIDKPAERSHNAPHNQAVLTDTGPIKQNGDGIGKNTRRTRRGNSSPAAAD